MPDEQELIRARLGKLGLGNDREEEIVRELSEYLADHAAAIEARGAASAAAAREALDSVSNWPQLRREIISAETEETIMNYRTNVLWLPALGAVTLSNVLLVIMQIFGPPPHFYWFYIGRSMEPFYVFILPWLISQPVVGAVAAYWSRRAGGAVRHQLLAAVAPAIALLALFLLLLPYAMIMNVHVALKTFAVLTATWALLPGLPLLLGAAPFLRKPQPQS